MYTALGATGGGHRRGEPVWKGCTEYGHLRGAPKMGAGVTSLKNYNSVPPTSQGQIFQTAEDATSPELTPEN